MLATGTIVAGYRIEASVGKGGMGIVYEAAQLSLSRKVALKLLPPDLSEDADFRERFRREGRIQARIDHPHVIPVYEAGESEHGLFLAMLLVRGPNLKQLIVRAQLDSDRVLRLLTPIAAALDAAHESGLTHRDIKPQNVLVTQDDHPYLADFGLTKTAGDRTLTRTGQFMGSLHYASPEQIQGGEIGRASDLYALTGVLYECLTGSVPYPRESELALIYAHISEAPPCVTGTRPELPEAIDAVVAKGMAKDPALRYESAAELLDEAAQALDPSADAFARPASAAAPQAAARDVVSPDGAGVAPAGPPRQRRNLTRPAWPVIGAILAVAALAGLLLGRSGEGDVAQAGTNVASSDSIELSFPHSWRRTERMPDVPGMKFEDPVALAPARVASGAVLVAGQIATMGPRLLPAAFQRRLRERSGRGEPVALSKLRAYRYRALRLRSGGRATVFVVPNTGGVGTVACIASSKTAGSALPACERIANSMTLVDEEPYPLGPDADYAETLGTIIADLNDARLEQRAKLRAAATRSAQAASAASLADAYEDAYRSLARVSVSPADQPVNLAMAIAARRTAAAYTELAAGASARERGRFQRAADRIRRGEVALSRALRRLARRGYEFE